MSIFVLVAKGTKENNFVCERCGQCCKGVSDLWRESPAANENSLLILLQKVCDETGYEKQHKGCLMLSIDEQTKQATCILWSVFGRSSLPARCKRYPLNKSSKKCERMQMQSLEEK